jgi:hypothetical protein
MKHKRMVIVINIMIVLATILAIVAIVLPIYTILQDMPGLSFGEPSYNYTNTSGYFNLPVTVSSRGPLPLSDIALQGYLTGVNNTPLLATSVGPMEIPVGSTTTVNVNVTFDFSHLSDEMVQNLATANQNLSLVATFRFSTSPLSSYELDSAGVYNWGAPLSNLRLGDPMLIALAPLAYNVSIPVYFQNNSTFFHVLGTADVQLVDPNSSVVSESNANVDCPPSSNFYGDILFRFNLTQAQANYYFFNDAVLNYSALLQLTTFGLGIHNLTEPISVMWGALAKDAAVGYPSAQYFNSTHSQVSIGFTFKDNSPYIKLDGYMSGTILDSGSNVVGVLQNQNMTVYPGATDYGTMTGYIKNDALGQPSYTVNLLFHTDLGEFEEEVNTSA